MAWGARAEPVGERPILCGGIYGQRIGAKLARFAICQRSEAFDEPAKVGELVPHEHDLLARVAVHARAAPRR